MEHFRRTRSARAVGVVAAAAAVVVALATAGCTGPGAAVPGTGRSPSATTTPVVPGAATTTPTSTTTPTPTATPTPTTRATAAPSVPSAPSAPSGVLPSGAPSGGTRPVPQRLTDTVRAQLVAAYVAANGYAPSWIAGLEPGTSYYAVVPATGVQLAWVTFQGSSTAPERVFVALQDEGTRTALRRVPGGAWTLYDICTTPAFLALVGGVLPAGGHCAAG